MKVNTNVVLGVLAVTAIGAMAGIILSEEKASTTKKEILKNTEDLSGHVKSFFSHFIDSLKGKFRNAKSTVEEVVEKGAAAYKSLS